MDGDEMNLLAWQVGPYDGEWAGIVHAPTRGKAKLRVIVEVGDFMDVRAKRLPQFDNKPVTLDALLAMGWSDEGEDPIPRHYTDFCGCEICRGQHGL